MQTKKSLSSIWMICAFFVFPCILNLEMAGCLVFIFLDAICAFLCFFKYNSEYVL